MNEIKRKIMTKDHGRFFYTFFKFIKNWYFRCNLHVKVLKN